MPRSELESDSTADAVPIDVCTFDVDLAKERRHILRQLLKAQRSIDITRVAMPLQLDRDHLPGSGNVGTSLLHPSTVPNAPWSRTNGWPSPWTS